MKIALVQYHADPDREANVRRGLEALREAASKGAQLVAYPELAFTRFYPQRPAQGDLLHLAEPIPGPTTQRFAALAKELGVVAILNLFERDGNQTYDSSPVIDADGSLLGVTRMVHIIEAPCFHEKGYYTPGDHGAPVYQTAVGQVGVAICYDRHFPEYMRALGLGGAELVVVPQAGVLGEWPEGLFEAELRVAGFQNGYFTALANRVGREEHVTFAGESFVTDPEGRVIARAPTGREHILYADIDLSQVVRSPARRHFLLDRRPEIYDDLIVAHE